MQIEISGHQIDVTPALRAYVEEKFERIERHSGLLKSAHFVLSVVKLDHRAEATIAAAGATLHADATAVDMYAAIDLLADKLDRQVRRHKERVTDHHRGTAAARAENFG